MNCRETVSLLESFHDGELHGREMREVAQHLAQCEACEGQLAQWDRLHALLSAPQERPAEDLSAIWAAVEEGIDAMPPSDTGWAGFRIAAASTNVRSIFGRQKTTASEAEELGDDPAEAIWLSPQAATPTSTTGMTFLRGGMALAASLFLTVLLFADEEPVVVGSSEPVAVATQAEPQANEDLVQTVAASRPQNGRNGPPREQLFGIPDGAPDGTLGAVRTAAAQQVQIRSLKQFGGEMAMWAEPAGNTAVIWLGEAAPQARR